MPKGVGSFCGWKGLGVMSVVVDSFFGRVRPCCDLRGAGARAATGPRCWDVRSVLVGDQPRDQFQHGCRRVQWGGAHGRATARDFSCAPKGEAGSACLGGVRPGYHTASSADTSSSNRAVRWAPCPILLQPMDAQSAMRCLHHGSARHSIEASPGYEILSLRWTRDSGNPSTGASPDRRYAVDQRVPRHPASTTVRYRESGRMA